MLLYPATDRQARFIALAASLVPALQARAAEHDRSGTFPVENIADIRAARYQALPVPERFGGLGANLLETCLAQMELGRADGSTALTLNMHLATIGSAGASMPWPEPVYERICRAVADGALINSAATEPELGSPASGGLPATRAHRDGEGWRINGHKTYVSGCDVLTWFLVPAVLEGTDPPATAVFLVPNGHPGLRIERTWDTIAMRASGSDDIYLDDVTLPEDAMIVRRRPGEADTRGPYGAAWGPLLVSSVYLGVATAARDQALRFARTRVPTALGHPIADLPAIQWKAAEMEIALITARTLVLSAAEDWGNLPERRAELSPRIAVAKTVAINQAIATTDIAMRITGGAGLSRGHPLERAFRDVRAGLTHPPLEDRAKEALGKAALASIQLPATFA